MSKEGKKMNSYIKAGLIMLLCVLAGGIIGFGVAFCDVSSVGTVMDAFLMMIRKNLLLILTVITVLMILLGEGSIRKLRITGCRLENAEDEESDLLDYELERISAVAITTVTTLSAISIIVLATGYSITYIEQLSKSENIFLLLSFGVFIIGCFYEGYWQIKFVKVTQKIDPAKKGDPTSLKFQEQWLMSCDEAERGMIYQATYRTYITMSKTIPVLILITMLSHLLWNTGILAVVIVGCVWVLQTLIYSFSCVKLKGKKRNA